MKLSWLPWILRKQVRALTGLAAADTARIAELERLYADKVVEVQTLKYFQWLYEGQIAELRQLKADCKKLKHKLTVYENSLRDKEE